MRNQAISAAVLLGLIAAGCGGSTQEEGFAEPITTQTATQTSTTDEMEAQIRDEVEVEIDKAEAELDEVGREISDDLTLDEKAVLVIDRMLTDDALRDNYCELFFVFLDLGDEEVAILSLVTSFRTNAIEIMGTFPPEAEELVRERALRCYDLVE